MSEVIKSIELKISPKTNRNKIEKLIEYSNIAREIAIEHWLLVINNNLQQQLLERKITANQLKNILHQKLYYKLKEQYKGFPSNGIQHIRDRIVAMFFSWVKLKRKGKRASLPSLNNLVMEFDKAMFKIFKEGKEFPFFIALRLLGKRIVFPLECGNYQEELLIDALNGKYKIGQIQLVEKKGEFYLYVPLKKKSKIKETETFLGVDLGYRKQAVISVIDKDGKILETKIISFKRHTEKLNYYLKRLSFYQSEAIKKNGKYTTKRIEKLWEKIKNLRKWIAHNVSKQIVDLADKYNAKIVMENLKTLKPSKKNKNWLNKVIRETMKGMIRNFVQYKADWKGLPTALINPKNTSKRCSFCGFVNENLKEEEIFSCPNCGNVIDRDLNASINIAFAGCGKPALTIPLQIKILRDYVSKGYCLKPSV